MLPSFAFSVKFVFIKDNKAFGAVFTTTRNSWNKEVETDPVTGGKNTDFIR